MAAPVYPKSAFLCLRAIIMVILYTRQESVSGKNNFQRICLCSQEEKGISIKGQTFLSRTRLHVSERPHKKLTSKSPRHYPPRNLNFRDGT